MYKARREEGFVRPKKGHEEAYFASDESLSIMTGDGEGDREVYGTVKRER